MDYTPEHSANASGNNGALKAIARPLSELSLEAEFRNEDESMRLRDYLAIAGMHRWLIIGITCLVTGLIAVWVGFSPDYYDSVARVEVNLETPENPNSMADPTYFNTQLQLISSANELRRVVVGLRLDQDPIFRSHMKHGGRLMRKMLRIFYLGPRDPDDQSDSTLIPSPLAPPTASLEQGEAERLAPYVEEIQRN